MLTVSLSNMAGALVQRCCETGAFRSGSKKP